MSYIYICLVCIVYIILFCEYVCINKVVWYGTVKKSRFIVAPSSAAFKQQFSQKDKLSGFNQQKNK